MKIIYEVFNHSGTMIESFETKSNIIPRVGEIVVLDEMDNTTEFIVTDILHYPKENFIKVKCESFYRQGGYTRYYHLALEYWLPPYPEFYLHKPEHHWLEK